MNEILQKLNDVQQKAVSKIEGPLMVIAGAGSGKTRVLTYRIAYMVKSGIDPFNILSLTFTTKAATEMKDRIIKILGSNDARNVWMGTFHSVFSRILRIDGDKLGYTRDFSIYDTEDSKNLIKTIIKELDLDIKTYKPSAILSRISMAKNNLLSDVVYAQSNEILQADNEAQRPRTHEIFAIYNKRLRRANAMDFDDLLYNTNVLFRDFPAVLHKYQQLFKYILVDEYQDTNYAQYLILKKLAANNENICVVGDDAQSIYAFRGANIQNILNFKSDYPDCVTFKLEQNYRSTKNIVLAANSLIKANKNQINKNIWTDNEIGQKIRIIRNSSESEEAFNVASTIMGEKESMDIKFSNIAVLYRTNAQSRAFEEAFRKLQIPYKIHGGLSFYKRKEIKDVIAYFRLVFNQHDEEALKRVINYPLRGIGQTTLDTLFAHSSNIEIPLWNLLENPIKYQVPLGSSARDKIQQFATQILSFKAQSETLNAYDLAYLIVTHTGIINDLSENKDEPERLKNVEELLNGIRNFVDSEPEPDLETGEISNEPKNLSDFLSQISLLSDSEEKEDKSVDKCIMMTIHSAKGLEFPLVFIVGMEENLFPSFMSLNSRSELEEERRLFYVAITRAEKKTYISYAETRYKWGQVTFAEPSRFIEDIEDQFIEYVNPKKPIRRPSSNFDTSIESPQEKYKIKAKTTQAPIAKTVIPSNFKKISTSAPAPPAAENASIEDLKENMRVYHAKFGMGEILELSGSDDNKRAVIQFDNGETKTLLLKYAKLSIS